MIQTGFIPSAHDGLVTDASYDYYGLHLATCSLDKRIIVWHLDEKTRTWNIEDEWKAHDAAVSKLSWAHPEFGPILASSSFDRTVKVWERRSAETPSQEASMNEGGSTSQSLALPSPPGSRWASVAVLQEAKGSVRAVEFAPNHFELKLATIATDDYLRLYEFSGQPSHPNWSLTLEIHIPDLCTADLSSPRLQIPGLAASSGSQDIQKRLQSSTQNRSGTRNREGDGGWCISWCKDKYWGEVIAVGCGVSSAIKIVQLSAPNRPRILLTLDPSPVQLDNSSSDPQTTGSVSIPTAPPPNAAATYSITCVAWAPSCGRSSHLIATGDRGGNVRIWKVKPRAEYDAEEGEDGGEEATWTATVIADWDHHKSPVGRVEWNITGTVLSSAGNDGRIQLWKATFGNVWRPATNICVVEAEDESPGNDRDIDMDGKQ